LIRENLGVVSVIQLGAGMVTVVYPSFGSRLPLGKPSTPTRNDQPPRNPHRAYDETFQGTFLRSIRLRRQSYTSKTSFHP
jgi:hypothetical protein